MKKNKIILVVTQGEVGGALSHIKSIIESSSSCFEMLLLVGEKEIPEGYIKLGETKILILEHLVRKISLFKDVRALIELYLIFKKERPSIVHAHTSKAGALSRIAASLLGISVLYTPHGGGLGLWVPPKKRMLYVFFEKLLSWMPTTFIAVSASEKEELVRLGVARSNNVELIKNGIPDISDKRCSKLKDSIELTVAIVARFSAPKDQLLAVKALKLCEDIPIKMVFIGDGPNRLLVENSASELGLKEKVEFIGSTKDVDRYLFEADVFLLPTNGEALPISIIEAMRAGLPVIASNVGGIPELVEDQKTGFLFEKGNERELSSRMVELYQDSDLRTRMGRAGRNKFLNEFGEQGMLTSLFRLYSSIADD